MGTGADRASQAGCHARAGGLAGSAPAVVRQPAVGRRDAGGPGHRHQPGAVLLPDGAGGAAHLGGVPGLRVPLLLVAPPPAAGADETARCRVCGLVLSETQWAATRTQALADAQAQHHQEHR